jgi:hypothetical protein
VDDDRARLRARLAELEGRTEETPA